MRRILLAAVILTCNLYSFGQTENLPKTSAGFPINYKEDSVGNYTLPDVLSTSKGKRITTAKEWTTIRRPELIHQFEFYQFGRIPARPLHMPVDVFEKGMPALNGLAIRKQVTIYLTKDSLHKMDLLIYLPAASKKPVPLILTVSFAANYQVSGDSAVRIGYTWSKEGLKITAGQPSRFGKMNIEQFIREGIGFATVYYGDIEPDFKTGYKQGIRGHYLAPGQTLSGEQWGAIAAWSWGLSRAMDYFETDPQIDAKRIALQGASRLGKTTLWTGARDPRFKVIIASISGEGGAALSRRDYGENIKHITDTSRYYYQFAPNYHSYASRVESLPFDAHMLVALVAPRALLLQTGDTDYWSDPKGEFLSAIAAEPVYQLFNEKGPGTTVMPVAGDTSLAMNKLGYYMHKGGHTVLPEDWKLFIEFMKKYL
jgi:hypothetical protein